MKKTLLLTILCAGQLYGMEVQKTDYILILPKELKEYILLTLTQSQTLEKAIQTIHSLAQTNKEFNTIANNPITIRTIIRFLAQKFTIPSEYIAQQLSTQGSQQYVALSLQLMHALWQHNWDDAENLIKAGADIDFQTTDTYPLICGLSEGMKQQWLEISSKIDNNHSQVIQEVQNDKIVLRQLNGIATFIVNNANGCIIGACFSLVMYAIASNQPAIIAWLINHNANLNLTMSTGDTALLMAINLGNKKIIELLVKDGADINQQNTMNATMHEKITKVVGYGNFATDIKKLNYYYDATLYSLLDHKTLRSLIITALNGPKATPIIRLIRSSRQFTQEEFNELLMLLINKGANLNLQDGDNNTPLRLLVFTNGHANLMKFLLNHGADPSIKDSDGMNALDRMLFEGTSESDPEREEKIRLLEDAMQKYQEMKNYLHHF